MARTSVTIGRVLVTVTILALTAMWIYVFLLADDVEPPDTLDDTTFATAAEPVCAARRDVIDALPPAQDATSADERADVIDEANAEFRDMIDELRGIDAGTGDTARIVGLWLDDWETYIADRQDYADALRSDPAATFFETARAGGDQISEAVDNLALVNAMPSCATPDDV